MSIKNLDARNWYYLLEFFKLGYVLEKIKISENKDSATSKTHCKMNSENSIMIRIYIYKCFHSKLFIVYGQKHIITDCFYAFYTCISSSELF